MRDKTKYGVKIKNISCGSLYAYNLGVRDKYEWTQAMLVNSLLLNFLKDNGLKIEKNGSTKDVIGINFNYKSYSYQEEIDKLNKRLKEADTDELKDFYNKTIQKATVNAKLFEEKSVDEIRKIYYNQGVPITYTTYKKDGSIKSQKTIHYNMLYRSTGKAKQGNCLFICDRLYKKAKDFMYMGYKLPKENAPIVEIGAYSSLIASGIVGTININPRDIFIMQDVKSLFKTNIVSVELDDNKHCTAVNKNNYELSNEMFDGQGLIDSSIFPSWGNGYILLRHHMTKFACFKSNIQQFFKDYYGENYETAELVDMFGYTHKVKDIKVITTNNAIKWLKFGISYDYWCQKVNENGNTFGIVKTAHESKLGDVQKMSYQMINSLSTDIMPKVVETTLQYINSLKTDDSVFLEYLYKNQNFSNDYNVLYDLCMHNKDFIKSQYFRDRKKVIISQYVKEFREGKIIQNGDNLVIVGSPYAMLLSTVGENPFDDDTFEQEDGTIQCFTNRFDDGEYLASFRSPHNSSNNIGYLHNHYSENMIKYFNFDKQIIAINMRNTDFQDRHNGSDQDSDSIYVTNQHEIVQWAKYCYSNYPTIVNNIPKSSKKYSLSMDSYALIDTNLAKSQNAIGESSNIAQLAQTYANSFGDKKYRDAVCILSVLAQVAIDNAKRAFDVDINEEIKLLKQSLDIENNQYPIFWKLIKDKKLSKQGKKFDYKKINRDLVCPMNYMSNIKIHSYKPNFKVLPMDYFFDKQENPKDGRRRTCRKVEELIAKYSLMIMDIEQKEDFILARDDFEQLIDDIRQVYISNNYLDLVSWLIDRAFCITTDAKRHSYQVNSNTSKNKSLLLKTLYDINPKAVIKCFSKNAKE